MNTHVSIGKHSLLTPVASEHAAFMYVFYMILQIKEFDECFLTNLTGKFLVSCKAPFEFFHNYLLSLRFQIIRDGKAFFSTFTTIIHVAPHYPITENFFFTTIALIYSTFVNILLMMVKRRSKRKSSGADWAFVFFYIRDRRFLEVCRGSRIECGIL